MAHEQHAQYCSCFTLLYFYHKCAPRTWVWTDGLMVGVHNIGRGEIDIDTATQRARSAEDAPG